MISALTGAAALAICALTVPAFAAPVTWNGALDQSTTTMLHFGYTGSRIVAFTIPTIACASAVNGYQYEIIYVPSIPVHGGRFSTTFHVSKKYPNIIIKVRGTITGSEASGTVIGSGVCDTQPQPFHANPGAFRPATPTRKAGSCTMSGCLASNGIFIRVTAVDRTIRGIPQPQGSITMPADPTFATGAVAVTVTEIDRSFKGPVLVNPAANFQLRLGSGVLSPGGGPATGTITGSGTVPTCNQIGLDNPLDEATLTQGGSFGPKTVCFGAPTAADRQHLTLYYMPGGGPVDAKIPLG